MESNVYLDNSTFKSAGLHTTSLANLQPKKKKNHHPNQGPYSVSNGSQLNHNLANQQHLPSLTSQSYNLHHSQTSFQNHQLPSPSGTFFPPVHNLPKTHSVQSLHSANDERHIVLEQNYSQLLQRFNQQEQFCKELMFENTQIKQELARNKELNNQLVEKMNNIDGAKDKIINNLNKQLESSNVDSINEHELRLLEKQVDTYKTSNEGLLAKIEELKSQNKEALNFVTKLDETSDKPIAGYLDVQGSFMSYPLSPSSLDGEKETSKKENVFPITINNEKIENWADFSTHYLALKQSIKTQKDKISAKEKLNNAINSQLTANSEKLLDTSDFLHQVSSILDQNQGKMVKEDLDLLLTNTKLKDKSVIDRFNKISDALDDPIEADVSINSFGSDSSSIYSSAPKTPIRAGASPRMNTMRSPLTPHVNSYNSMNNENLYKSEFSSIPQLTRIIASKDEKISNLINLLGVERSLLKSLLEKNKKLGPTHFKTISNSGSTISPPALSNGGSPTDSSCSSSVSNNSVELLSHARDFKGLRIIDIVPNSVKY